MVTPRQIFVFSHPKSVMDRTVDFTRIELPTPLGTSTGLNRLKSNYHLFLCLYYYAHVIVLSASLNSFPKIPFFLEKKDKHFSEISSKNNVNIKEQN